MAPPWPSGDPRSTVERPRESGPNGLTSLSGTAREDRRHERRGLHDALPRLDADPLAAPDRRPLISDALQQTMRGGLRTQWSRPSTASAQVRVPPEFGLLTFAGTACDCPTTISDRWAVGPKFRATRRARSGGRPRRCDHGDGRGRSASTGPSPQRHSPDDSVLEDRWPTTPRPRSARATTG